MKFYIHGHRCHEQIDKCHCMGGLEGNGVTCSKFPCHCSELCEEWMGWNMGLDS